VLFELLTGEPPFTGDTPVAVAYQHVREDPRRPSELNPQVSPALDAIVLKALSKNPANRYQSAAEMRADLVRVRAGQAPLAPTVMSEDERTALLAAPPTGHTRRINGTRHTPALPPAAAWDDEVPERRTRRVAIGVAAALMVGLVAFVGYLIFTKPSGPAKVSVPNLVGQQQEAARSALSEQKLLGTIESVASTADQRGLVVSTEPGAGTAVTEGSTVKLLIGKGPDQTTVPVLRGLTLDQATQALKDRGLLLGTPTEQDVTDPAQVGKIVSSDPEGGASVAGNTPVAVVVGKQRTTVQVPNVTGQEADAAEAALRKAGFQVNRTPVDDGGQDGTVAATNPAGGTPALSGSTVVMQVSTTGDEELDVPDVTDRSVDEAVSRLRDRGFKNIIQQPRPTTDEGDVGRVLDQSPSADSRAPADQRITLVVGRAAGGGTSGSGSPSSSPGGN
jgi:serine/threonine-protein kinase